ncbi:MAG: exodeoxyribonuclease V subunit beta [Acidobacteriota bacterium]|nr:exodeoxyribonuclease V subunit beta [Acidobacteriota bacterium]
MTRVFELMHTPIKDGMTLIEASAGTGKTYTITGLVLRLLLEQKVAEIGEVLVVTFTNAATQELHDRIRTRLRRALHFFSGRDRAGDDDLRLLWNRHGEAGRKILEEALLRFDEVAICTIHGFCKRVLEESAFESGVPFDAEFLVDDAEMRLQAAQDFWRRTVTQGPKYLANLAVARGWKPEAFLGDYTNWRRYPQTQILPEHDNLDALGGRLQEVLVNLGRCYDRQSLRELLQAAEFKKDKSPFQEGKLEMFLGRVEAVVLDGDYTGLGALLELSPAALGDTLYKRVVASVTAHPFISACDPLAGFVDEVEQSLRIALIRGMHANFEQMRLEDNLLTYDDLLERLYRAVIHERRGPRIRAAMRAQYRAVLIDEFQDTDLIQYEIFSRCFKDYCPLFLIGDPKQAIYSFRGADIFAYLAAKREAVREFTLNKNWRSHRRLVQAVNTVFAEAQRPFVFDDISFHPVEAAGKADEERLEGDDQKQLCWLFVPPSDDPEKQGPLNRTDAEDLICKAVAAECLTLLTTGVQLGERKLHPGDIAVLVRSNDQAALVRNALSRANLPCVIAQSGDIFRTTEMMELHLLLEAVIDPLRRTALNAALATELWGKDALFIHGLDRDETAWQEIIDRCAEYRRRWVSQGFMPMIQKIFTDLGMRYRLRKYMDGERRLTNFLHAAELLHQQSVERDLSPEALIRWLAFERARDSRDDRETCELRLESDARAVQIVTVHKSKGLEYNVVFCPFLWYSRPVRKGDNVVAHARPDQVVYDCGSDDYERHRALAEGERVAEDLRLAYVAMTRAKQRCYVVWGPMGSRNMRRGARSNAFASAMGYLLHQPPNPAESTGNWIVQTMTWLGEGWESWETELNRKVRRHADCMSLMTVPAEVNPGRMRSPSRQGEPLAMRRFPVDEELPRGRRIASFSSLTSGHEAERPDYEDPADPTVDDAAVPPRGIFAFARGAHPGICLHEILEELDFRYPDDEEAERRVTEILGRYELLEASRHPHALDPRAAVMQMLRQVLRTPIPGEGFSLDELAPEQRLNEWQFYLPMGRVTPRHLADLFEQHARPWVRRDYVPMLRQLDADTLHGFLTGYVDLCFEHRGHWYVVDWKSNYLGAESADYGPDAVRQAMCTHHYVLQYYLYVTALHRFLKWRQPDYRYETHMGPAVYVFLRGVGEGERGWYVDQPPIELIEALDAFFHGEEGTA